LKLDRLDIHPSPADVDDTRTLDQCAGDLTDLSRSGSAYSESRIDALVDSYLVGFGTATPMMRKRLAEAFAKSAPVSELCERKRKRIEREDRSA